MMRLPMPNAEEVDEFKVLYKKQTGVELTEQEAREAATILVHLFFIQHYGIHPLCPKE